MELYKKYRPNDFNEMFGDRTELKSLENTIMKENKPHVYLFHGDSGSGKTTAARICAKKLGANDFSIQEFNSSNNRGIDTARDIIELIKTMPTGESWVFIIDEAHKTTNDWQNAMLKPLEDCPENVYFFICTTEPNKLISTFKSRCTKFKFKSLKQNIIYKILVKINKKENFNLNKEILEDVAEASNGNTRQALVLLDKISTLDKKEAEKLLSNGLEDEENKNVIDLCRALLNNKTQWDDVAEILKNITEEPETIRYIVLGYMNSILLKGKSNNKAALIMDYFSENFYDSKKYGVTLACYNIIHEI